QDGDHHLPHITVGTDPVVNKPNRYTLSIKLFYQLDHVGGVAAKTVELLHQNDITP
ncbi:hypothetical protein SM61_05518, partial [Klebsiella pneumoniae]